MMGAVFFAEWPLVAGNKARSDCSNPTGNFNRPIIPSTLAPTIISLSTSSMKSNITTERSPAQWVADTFQNLHSEPTFGQNYLSN